MRGFRSTSAAVSRLLVAAALLTGAAACDSDDDGLVGPPIDSDGFAPRNVDADSAWVTEGWVGVDPVGQPAVQVVWDLPEVWDGEPFRVYAKQASRADYILIATVTSCGDEGICRYTDLNVAPGQTYDYFVATVFDERRGDEEPSTAVSVTVPQSSAPETPAAPQVTALDNALYLQWPSTGADRYQIFLERIGADETFLLIGETDGTGYLDERAENGVAYSYRIAGVDETGRPGTRSGLGTGTARPDYHAELIYTLSDSLAASGFRFQLSEADNPIVAGDASGAQWRVETVGGVPSIRPIGSATMTRGVFTTSLTCGPGSEDDCESIDQAPAAEAFSTQPAAVETGNSYVFRVTGDDNRTHYGKVRVQGVGEDAGGNAVVVFDWAYQLRADEPSLSRR